MKITIELDQKAMSKSRNFVRMTSATGRTELMTVKQAQTIASGCKRLGMEVINNTGLIF